MQLSAQPRSVKLKVIVKDFPSYIERRPGVTDVHAPMPETVVQGVLPFSRTYITDSAHVQLGTSSKAHRGRQSHTKVRYVARMHACKDD